VPTDATSQPKPTVRGDDPRWDEFQVKGEQLLAKVKELVRQGNIRRLVIANEDGKTLVEVPLTVGVVGALLVPVAVAIGAIAAVVTDCTIRVERTDGGGA
jgi:hypothetical protein